MLRTVAFLALVSVCGHALAQAAPEYKIWQDKKQFEPSSRTSSAISGPVKISKNTISFNGGRPVKLSEVGMFWREWDVIDGKESVTLYHMGEDPGPLVNGNYLCSEEEKAQYIAFYNVYDGDFADFGISIFSGKKAPFDVNSPTLCGTFSYKSTD